MYLNERSDEAAMLWRGTRGFCSAFLASNVEGKRNGSAKIKARA
jgi:hypothetical protein